MGKPVKSPRTIRQRATRARELRRNATPAETRLWYELRAIDLPGKLRRQHPIGEFIADFAIPAAKLVIEVDGDTHVADDERDAKRTAFMEAKGWRVVRFSNADVMSNTEAVLQAILEALKR